LRDARIFDGPSPEALVISHARTRHGELGWLVSYHLIRRAAWSAMQEARARNGDIALYSPQRVATQPLYLATRWIAQLYTAESPTARTLRQLALRWARHTPPFQHLVAAALTG
jgi:hypothetical protein